MYVPGFSENSAIANDREVYRKYDGEFSDYVGISTEGVCLIETDPEGFDYSQSGYNYIDLPWDDWDEIVAAVEVYRQEVRG